MWRRSYFLKLRIRSEGKNPRTEISRSTLSIAINALKTIADAARESLYGAARREFLHRVQAIFRLAGDLSRDHAAGMVRAARSCCRAGALSESSSIAVCLATDENNVGANFVRKGTLGAGRRSPSLRGETTRLMLAMALSFVGPLGDLLRVEQVMIQLVGEPDSGKSGIAVAAGASVGRQP